MRRRAGWFDEKSLAERSGDRNLRAMPLHDRDYMREQPPSFGDKLRGMTAFHAVFWLNILIFVGQFVFEIGFGRGGISVQELAQGHLWTVITYMFVHQSVGHILVNMLLLWFAGKQVQAIYGPRHFLQIYLISGVVGAALQMAVGAYVFGDTVTHLVGASGACMGLLLALAVAIPEEQITLMLYFIVPVRLRLITLARFLLLLNGALAALDLLQILPGWLSDGAAVAYFAHIGGALAGWYYARTLGYGGIPVLRLHERPTEARRQRRMEMARSTRHRPVVDVDVEAARRRNPTNDPKVDIMRDEVDPILDKISEQGLHSLSDEERRILERASREMGRKSRRQ